MASRLTPRISPGGGRSPMQSLASSPVMVGAITTLVVIVAVFLAYNATNGLPFVPVYRISAELPNAARLQANNEVRIAGRRIGIVEDVVVVQGEDGKALAKANLKLDKSVEPLPKDTHVRVRYSSAFGLKYLELAPGHGPALPEGGTLPQDQVTVSTEFDDVGDTFDARTREAVRASLVGFSGALAGRGESLNTSIAALDPVLRHLGPVADELAAGDTRLRRLIRELGDAARIVAPVATETSDLFGNASRTFAAIAADPAALQAAISEGVPTLTVGTAALRATRPFLEQATSLALEVRPATRQLDDTLPGLNGALFAGAEVLPGVPELSSNLSEVLGKVDALADQPQTKTTILRLRDTFGSADHAAVHLVPFESVCDYLNYWFTNFPNGHSEPTNIGTTQRDTIAFPPGTSAPPNDFYGGDDVPMGPLADYAGVAANGRRTTAPIVPQPGIFDPHVQPIFHGGAYGPPVVDKQGRPNCLGGQTGYPLGVLRVPGQPASNPMISTPAPGYLAGPTYAGRNHLP